MDQETLLAMREVFLAAPESGRAQIFAWILSLSLLIVVLVLVRRRTLRAEYTPIWIGVSVGLFLAVADLDLLRSAARMLGAWTISSTIFFLGLCFLLAICLNYAVRLSQAGDRIRELAQEIALLRQRMDAGAVGTEEPGPSGRAKL
ncbi:MAG: DUF2304 domain-containing protein [Deltaproteobacteria bacterium]|nr:DUF2304 domain-containing protein [Deltaproteobacteria bacterium]MBW2396877.1 DUF2304 domain-containing protein [Deltaproteobacteria bacterium]